MKLTIVKNTLTDGSLTFDLLLQKDGESMTIELPQDTEERVNKKVDEFHRAFESLLGESVTWGDMIG